MNSNKDLTRVPWIANKIYVFDILVTLVRVLLLQAFLFSSTLLIMNWFVAILVLLFDSCKSWQSGLILSGLVCLLFNSSNVKRKSHFIQLQAGFVLGSMWEWVLAVLFNSSNVKWESCLIQLEARLISCFYLEIHLV